MNYSEKLSRENSAVILVDFLDGFLPGLRTIDHLLLRKNAEALTRLSSLFNLPTLMLGEEGGFRGNFFKEVVDHAGHATRIERHTPSAWDEPTFRDALAATGRKKIILGGISLDICTLLLTIDLIGAGYEPYVVVDVSGSDTELNQTAAMLRMTQAGAVMVTVGSIASEIMRDWQTPEGKTVGELYQDNSYWGRRV